MEEEITVNVGALRDYLEDCCGSAAFNGFPAAIMDVVNIERMDDYELCEKTERMGIDLRRFEG